MMNIAKKILKKIDKTVFNEDDNLTALQLYDKLGPDGFDNYVSSLVKKIVVDKNITFLSGISRFKFSGDIIKRDVVNIVFYCKHTHYDDGLRIIIRPIDNKVMANSRLEFPDQLAWRAESSWVSINGTDLYGALVTVIKQSAYHERLTSKRQYLS